MAETLAFEVFGVAAPKGNHKIVPVTMKSGRQRFVITDQNERMRPWQERITLIAQQHRPPIPWDGPVALTLTFHLPKPKSLPKRRPSWHLTKPDLDKIERAVTDALTGVVYRDDAQVVHCTKTKLYGEVPSVIVRAERLTLEEHGHLLQEIHLSDPRTVTLI